MPKSNPLFFAFWFTGMRGPKWPGRSLDFQLNGITVSPDGRISPVRMKMSERAVSKVVRMGSRDFTSRLLGVIARELTPILILLFWTSE